MEARTKRNVGCCGGVGMSVADGDMSLRVGDEGEPSHEATADEESERLEIEDCFHGFITKREAEARLLEKGVEGSLLIRAEQSSSSTKQKYCISWLSPSHHSVLHYPVTLICGDYFLFGRRFSSLSEVVQDFISRSDAVVTPFRPPSPVELTNRQRIAILPFCAMDDSDELTFFTGDLLTEIQQVNEQWIWARLERTFQSGLVAVELTIPLNDGRVSAEDLPYFFGEPLEVLARRLMEAGVGSYLLRKSHRSSKDGFALMVNSGERIEKFLITRTKEGSFELGGRTFPTVPDIVDRYSKREIRDGIKLLRAVVKANKGDASNLGMVTSKSPLLRLHSYNSCPHFLACTSAYRRHKEDKWKSCFVMLSDVNGSELFVFESEKRAKPRAVLELSFCSVFDVDESVADRPNCIYVTMATSETSQPTTTSPPQPSSSSCVLFSLSRHAAFLQWLCLLRARCLGHRQVAPLTVFAPTTAACNFRASSFICLTLIGYRGPLVKTDYNYSCLVLVNGVRVKRTRCTVPSSKSTLSFDSVHFIEDVPSGPCRVQLELCPQNKAKTRLQMLKDTCFRELSTEFTLKEEDIEKCESAEDTFDGFVFRAVRHRLLLLPEEQYASFFVLLTSHDFLLPQWTASTMSQFNRDYFLQLLLPVFLSSYPLFFSFVDVLLDAQLASEAEMSIFRPDSLCTKCISMALRFVGRDVFLEELTEVLQPFRADKLINFDSDEFIKALWNLTRHWPPLFGAILARVARAAAERFPKSAHCASLRAVNNFFLLRFVNPILSLCNGFGPSARHLAKAVQLTANQVCSSDFSMEFATRGTRLMAKLLDWFVKAPPINEEVANPYDCYRKEEHLAMLAFQVARLTEQRTDCPVPEAAAVLRLLREHSDRFFATT